MLLCQQLELLKEGFKLEEINKWLNHLTSFLPKPDLTIILDAKPEICLERIYQRNKRRGRKIYTQQIEEIFYLRENFFDICSDKKRKIKLLDANQNINFISNQIISVVEKFNK